MRFPKCPDCKAEMSRIDDGSDPLWKCFKCGRIKKKGKG